MVANTSRAEHDLRKGQICVVDANPKFRNDVVRALSSLYFVQEFAEHGAALEAMAVAPPAAIILDENVTPRGGLPLLREICCVPVLDKVPIICTATHDRSIFLSDAMALGIKSTLVKPFRRSALLGILSEEINTKVERSWLRIEPLQQVALQKSLKAFNTIADSIGTGVPVPYDIIREACDPVVESVRNERYRAILNGVRNHDNYTYVHSLRVSVLLTVFGNAIGIKGHDLLTLATGGLIHDVGKISVPYKILNSSERLSDAELAIMRSHVTNSAQFLNSSLELPRGSRIIAEQHHERLDGTGYPRGLKGAELNELARMATIIDIFGALTDRRTYKTAMEPEKALQIMTQMKGIMDQHMLKTFRNVLLDIAKFL